MPINQSPGTKLLSLNQAIAFQSIKILHLTYSSDSHIDLSLHVQLWIFFLPAPSYVRPVVSFRLLIAIACEAQLTEMFSFVFIHSSQKNMSLVSSLASGWLFSHVQSFRIFPADLHNRNKREQGLLFNSSFHCPFILVHVLLSN